MTCAHTNLPTIKDCCKPNPNINIQNVLFFKKSDIIVDDNGNFVRIKRKYGKFNRIPYKSKEELILNL